ncbi:MAG: RNA polymerase sigma factor [Planctomycetes bacterium]|nr:RNA polymerase sigma factor [Planctomycetota bacterium]
MAGGKVATRARGARGEWDLPAEVAIPRLLEEHGGRMYSLGLRLCRDAHRAEDLVQETFLRAWRGWDRFEGRSSPATWLYSIASRVCRRFHRRRAGEPAGMASLEELLPFGEPGMPDLPGSEGGDPAGRAALDEARARVEEAVADLPPAFRLPLVLKDLQGLSVADTARVLGLREATVKTRLHRARLRLRQAVVEGLPRRDGPALAYSRRVCLDLLAAKQEALDRGVPFPLGNEVVCERCRSVFASMDLAAEACAALAAGGPLPEGLRRRILGAGAGAAATGSSSPARSPRGARPAGRS